MFTNDMHGINHWGDVLDLASEHEIVKKLGAFYSYGDLRLGQGREAAKGYLREHTDMAAEIEIRVRSAAGVIPSTAPSPEEADAEEDALVTADAGSGLPLDL
jgi:recombination protein RecA